MLITCSLPTPRKQLPLQDVCIVHPLVDGIQYLLTIQITSFRPFNEAHNIKHIGTYCYNYYGCCQFLTGKHQGEQESWESWWRICDHHTEQDHVTSEVEKILHQKKFEEQLQDWLQIVANNKESYQPWTSRLTKTKGRKRKTKICWSIMFCMNS